MSEHHVAHDYTFKVLIVGSSGTGKSCLMTRFAELKYDDTYISTIGVDYKLRTIIVKGSDGEFKKVKLQIWDTAGQERFRTITSSYYRSSHGVILVYDVTNRDTFDDLKSWNEEVDLYTTVDTMNLTKTLTIAKLLVGNKCDMTLRRNVTREEGKQFAKANGMDFIETSAKTGTGVDTAFIRLTTEMIKNYVPPTMMISPPDLDSSPSQNMSCCCR